MNIFIKSKMLKNSNKQGTGKDQFAVYLHCTNLKCILCRHATLDMSNYNFTSMDDCPGSQIHPWKFVLLLQKRVSASKNTT